jgi:hypothetical protein
MDDNVVPSCAQLRMALGVGSVNGYWQRHTCTTVRELEDGAARA